MNADQLEILCKGLEDAMTGLETMIQFSKTQADRIAELEKALDWIATVNAMDYEYQDVAKSLLKERHGIK